MSVEFCGVHHLEMVAGVCNIPKVGFRIRLLNP